MQIALLHDQPAVVDVLTTLVRVQGSQVQAYHNGSSLLDTLFEQDTEKETPGVDLLLLADTIAGDLSVSAVVQAVRRRFTQDQLPIIVLSGLFAQETLLHVQFPEMPILREPFHLTDVLAQVRRWDRQA